MRVRVRRHRLSGRQRLIAFLVIGTVGLIEVMKVFNSVRATVKGTVTQVVAQNGQFVEYGQTLFLVKP